MNLNPYIENVQRQLAAAGATGGDDARALAERLAPALESAVRLALQDALAAAADEITCELAPGSVELRLRGRDPEFVVSRRRRTIRRPAFTTRAPPRSTRPTPGRARCRGSTSDAGAAQGEDRGRRRQRRGFRSTPGSCARRLPPRTDPGRSATSGPPRRVSALHGVGALAGDRPRTSNERKDRNADIRHTCTDLREPRARGRRHPDRRKRLAPRPSSRCGRAIPPARTT